MDDKLIEQLHNAGTDHFWIMAKKWYLNKFIPKERANILDVGCGSGDLLKDIEVKYHNVYGIDINEKALSYCKSKGYKVYRADLSICGSLNKFNQKVDIIFAFDFLEHIKEARIALVELRKISSLQTALIITVPAHKFLFGKWDVNLCHYRRYSKKELESELYESGWILQKSCYIHILPLIPAVLSRFFFNKLFGREDELCFYMPSRTVNRICKVVYKFEFACYLLGLTVPGLSILAVAKTNKEQM